MLNIHKEIKNLVYDRGTTITKTLNSLREKGIKVPVQNNFSTKCKKGTIKFEEVQQILDYLGYELVIKEK